jgi:signal transduction histidine kinase
VALLGLANVAIWAALRAPSRLQTLRRVGLAALSIDTTVLVAFTYLYAFQEYGTTWALLYISPLEAALRYGMRGTVVMLVAVSLLYLPRELVRQSAFGYQLIPASISFRLGILWTIGLFVGATARVVAQERDAKEAALRRAEERETEALRANLRLLEERDRLKDELVGVVSHELRTPLTTILGFTELLRTRQWSEEERQELLEIMQQEGARLTELLNDLLELQRQESGRAPIVPQVVQVDQLCRQAASAAGEDPLRPLRLRVPSDLPPVLADANRIHQVLSNLISNARKYSPDGGTVGIAARAVDGAVEIAVSDRGLGFPPEAQDQLFGKFYRVDSPERRGITGTGLGLAICKRIVEEHGGRIWAASPGPGQGSTFAFTLPRAPAGARAAPAATEPVAATP